MSLKFHNLKLILNTKDHKNQSLMTRYGKIVDNVVGLLRGNKDNVKSIKLQDKDSNEEVELVGSGKEERNSNDQN